MAEIDKIKYSDLFDGDPFEQARINLEKFIAALDGFSKNNKKVAQSLQETLKVVSKTNFEELTKLEKLLKVSKQLANQELKAKKEKEKLSNELTKIETQNTKEVKKSVELTFEQLVAIEKQKLEKQKLTKEAQRQAKEELGLLKTQEGQIGAYKKLSDRLNQLRKVYKDLAAEAKTLELAGENPERIKEIRDELRKLQPEIDELDKSLKNIDANVGQFQRQVGSYKIAFVEAFDEVKGKINENVKGLLGLDERFEGVSDGVSKAKEAFVDFNEELKKSPTFIGKIANGLSNLGKLASNLLKAGGIGILIIALTNLQAVAQRIGGTFDTVKDNFAGFGEVLTGITAKLVGFASALKSLSTEGLDGFKKKTSQALDIDLAKLQKLGTEISRLSREIEAINKLIENSLGNLDSDIQTAQQAAQNALLSDKERYAAAAEAFKLQKQELDARLLGLNKLLEIQKKQLQLALEINGSDKETIEVLENQNLTTQERIILLNKLGNETRTAYLAIDETLGNIEVNQEERLRKQVEFQNFILEKALSDAERRAKAELAVLKSSIDAETKLIGDNVSFETAIKKTEEFTKKIKEGVAEQLNKIFQIANINLKEFNGLNALAISDVEELDNKLIALGVGEAYRAPIIDIWKDGQTELNKYILLLDSLNKARAEAISQGKKDFASFKQIAAEVELQFDIQQKQLEIERNGGVQNYKELVTLERKLLNLKIENLEKQRDEELKNARLVPEQRLAIEQKYQNQINQLRQDSELLRQQREIEYNESIKKKNEEILEILRKRQELELSTKLEQSRKKIILTLNRSIALQKKLAEIENERITIQQREEEKQAKTFEELEKIAQKYAQKRIDLENETSKKIVELQKQQLNEFISFGQQVITEAQNQLSQSFTKQAANIDNQISKLQDAINKEKELASAGLSSNLDELERKVAEFEAKKREQAKKEQAAQLALAFINSLAGYTKEDPNTAVQKAFRDILLAKVLAGIISGAFREGVENFQGKGTETSDSNLVLISKGESVITAEGTKKYKGLATAMNDGNVEQWITNNYQNQNSLNIDVDELGNLITKRVSDAGKRIVRSISSRPKL